MKSNISISFALLIILTPSWIWANISAPPEPNKGNITGQGDLKHISVLSEDLTINLSEVTKGGALG